MKIILNRDTNQVTGINTIPNPLELIINVPDSLVIKKIVSDFKEYIHKTNQEKLPLYFKPKTKMESRVIGKKETMEDTGDPVMIIVQKKDERGKKLYLQKNGEEETEVTSALDSFGQPNEPIMIEVQKTTEFGRLLFWEDDYADFEVEDGFEEVIEGGHVDGEEFIPFAPVMIPTYNQSYVSIQERPYEFTATDVLTCKFNQLLEKDLLIDNLLADPFLNEEDLDLEAVNHSANTGVGLVQLLPQGQCKTKIIELEKPSKTFRLLEFDADSGVEIGIGDKKFVDGLVTFNEPISKCTVKFTNPIDKFKRVRSYVIGY